MKRVAWPVHRWVSHHRGGGPDGSEAGAATREEPGPGRLKGIRRRRPRDVPACASLLGVVYTEGQYPVRWPDAPRAWLSAEEVTDAWVFERGGEIHGHIAVTKVDLDTRSALRWRELTGRDPSQLAGITRFFVRPRLRGQGIGKALLDVAVADIRARGLTPVADLVSRSSDAIRLYEDLGWRRRAGYPWGERDEQLEIYFYEAPPATGEAARD